MGTHTMRRISWTQFETFTRCPLWHSWSYPEHGRTYQASGRERPKLRQQQDTQYLAKGNATQGIIDRWANEHWYELDEKKQQALLEDKLPFEIEEAIQRAEKDGPVCTSALEMELEIRPDLRRVLPILTEFKNRIHPGKITDDLLRPRSQVTHECSWAEHILYAKLDLVLYTPEGVPTIIEGKSTKKPSKVQPDQLRWQIEIVRQKLELPIEHYFLFYSTAQFWPVSHKDDGHTSWIDYRNEVLRKITEGHALPTPSPFNCQICRHSHRCQFKHKPKKRITPAVEGLPKGRSTTISMD
jgi:hypothetical protein